MFCRQTDVFLREKECGCCVRYFIPNFRCTSLHACKRYQKLSKREFCVNKESSVCPERAPGRKGVTKPAGWTVCYALRKSYENASPPPVKTGAEAKVWKGGETKVGSFGRTDRQGEREEKDNLTGGADLFEAVCARNKWQYNTEEKGGAALMEKLHPFFPGPSHPPILSFYFFVPESCLHCLSMLYSYASAATKFGVAYAC